MAPLPKVRTYVRVNAADVISTLAAQIEKARKKYGVEEIAYFAARKRALDWSDGFKPDLVQIFAALVNEQAKKRVQSEDPKMDPSGTYFHFYRPPGAKLWATLKQTYPKLRYRNILRHGDIGTVSLPVSSELPTRVPHDESIELQKLYEKLPQCGEYLLPMDSELLDGFPFSNADFVTIVE